MPTGSGYNHRAMTTTLPPTAAETYAARIDAVIAQRTRLRGDAQAEEWSEGPALDAFRAAPNRPLDASLELIASYLEPDDVLVDVGGGAGRIALALAARCRQVVNVDASPVMLRAFTDSAREAGITNARTVAAHWPDVPASVDVTGDLVIVANVTYFVRDIVPFIQALEAAARRRVIIDLWTTPPVARNGALFARVYGEDEALVPTHRELLAVLWDLGIVPDVRVVPGVVARSRRPLPGTRDEAIQSAVATLGREQWAVGRLSADWEARARTTIEANFDDLFSATPEGFRARWTTPARELLITWPARER